MIDCVVAPFDHWYDCAVSDELAVSVMPLQNSLAASEAVIVVTGVWPMVIIAGVELAVVAHRPTTARYCLVCVRFVYDCDVVVLATVVQLTPLLIENSHLMIVPDWPDNVNTPLLLPVHTAVLPLTVPPTAALVTVIVAAAAFAEAHDPLCTTARYIVVCVRLV